MYFDIVPERRLVYAYDMYWQGKKISVSLASVEFVRRQGKRHTKLIVTEQHAFLDGYEDGGSRERGTLGLMLDNLDSWRSAGGDYAPASREVDALRRSTAAGTASRGTPRRRSSRRA